MPGVAYVFVNKPPEKDMPDFEDVGNALKKLSHLSGVEADFTGSVGDCADHNCQGWEIPDE